MRRLFAYGFLAGSAFVSYTILPSTFREPYAGLRGVALVALVLANAPVLLLIPRQPLRARSASVFARSYAAAGWALLLVNSENLGLASLSTPLWTALWAVPTGACLWGVHQQQAGRIPPGSLFLQSPAIAGAVLVSSLLCLVLRSHGLAGGTLFFLSTLAVAGAVGAAANGVRTAKA